jgi:hypothetical protein
MSETLIDSDAEVERRHRGDSAPTLRQWWDVSRAAQYAGCGTRLIYSEVRRGKLRAARLGGRRELRFLVEWIDAWLLASSTPEIVVPRSPDDDVRRDRVKSASH